MKRTLLLWAVAAAIALGETPASPPDAGDLEAKLKAAGAKGQPVETGEMLAGDPVDADGVESRTINLSGSDIATTMLTSDSGGSVFLADRTGVIRKISLPTWKEERRLWIGKPVTALASCKEGILAAVPADKMLILVKEDSLTVAYHWTLDEVGTVIAMPHGGGIYVPKTVRGVATELQVLDQQTHGQQRAVVALEMMQAQAAAGSYKKHPGAKQLSTFENMIASPKGDYLLCTSSDGIFRLGVKGVGLTIEEAGAPLGRVKHLAVSPDGVYFAGPAPEASPEGWPVAKGGGSLIFKSRDLQKPTAAVEGTDVWGFTRSAEKVFGLREPGTFVQQTAKGKIDHSYALGVPSAGVVAIEAAGDSGKFILHLGTKLVWVVLK
ncbi:MAG: hypothetical protein K8T20_00455 [Planctomycetes bacterium]|nr:hypothetical protein [Planctomycetota bacterium]